MTQNREIEREKKGKMFNKKFILVSVSLILLIIPFSSQQFSYSANWGKRSDYELTENPVENAKNLLDVIMSHEEVYIYKSYSKKH